MNPVPRSTEPRPAEVRALVIQALRELGLDDTELQQLRDTLLLQGGRYCGRTFRAGGLMAMWMFDVGLLTFYAADGTIVRTIEFNTPATIPLPAQPAAKAA